MGKASRRKQARRAAEKKKVAEQQATESKKKKLLKVFSRKKSKAKAERGKASSSKSKIKSQKTKATKSAIKKKEAVKKAKSTKKAKSAKTQKPRKTINVKISNKEKTVESQLTAFEKATKSSIENFSQKVKNSEIHQALKKRIKEVGYIAGGIGALVVLLLAIEVISHNRVFPGTKLGDLEIGYMPAARAYQEVGEAVKNFKSTPLKFVHRDNVLEIPVEELGIEVSVEQTLANVPRLHFQNSNPFKLFALAVTGREVPVSVEVDSKKLMKSLENKFNIGQYRAKNARLVLENGEFVVQSEQNGRIIDIDKLAAELEANIQKLDGSTIALSINDEKPTILTAQIEQDREPIINLIHRPITLSSDYKNLTIELVDHLNALEFNEKTESLLAGPKNANAQDPEAAPQTKYIKLALKEDEFGGFLQEELLSAIEVPTSPANIYSGENGEVVIEGKGEDGRTVPIDELVDAITEAANNGTQEINVPVLFDPAPLAISDDLKAKGIKELVATGHSSYYGSPANRMFNIEYGSAKYNGHMIAPGEEFSFNEVLGKVDSRSGFKVEKIIKENKIEYEVGGGICQVSTTMYRAALLAGLPITERKPHSWKVHYYSQSMGDGLDATIYPGVSDVKFTNDTPGHLLIQAYTDGPEAYFKIYGTKDGRKVEMDGPHGGGLTWHWNRTVLDKDGNPIAGIGDETGTEEIWSRYRPIPPPEPDPPEDEGEGEPEPAAEPPPPADPPEEGF